MLAPAIGISGVRVVVWISLTGKSLSLNLAFQSLTLIFRTDSVGYVGSVAPGR